MKSVSLILICIVTTSCLAQNGAPAYVSRKAAGDDWKIQGEYTGELADGNKWGAQVVATGKGAFQAIGFEGGLPGDGWRGERGQILKGKLKDGSVRMDADEFYIIADGKTLRVFGSSDDTEYGALDRVIRKSKTLGAKPADGAIVLFDGTSTDQWKNAKLVQKKLLGPTNCFTREKFGDHTLHIEFRTPFMPLSTGQGRGNSGVYVQSRYEIQVLDSFGLEGKDNECGGIYKVSKPKVNMCYPPLTWQTYDIDFTAAKWDGDKKVANAKLTVRHNGVVIHQDLELPTHTPGRHRESPEPDSLFLQDHGNPVAYRNIWIEKK